MRAAVLLDSPFRASRMVRFNLVLLLGIGGAAAWAATLPAVGAAPPIQFDRDVQPILSNHCWSCHGPDEATREAGLRLDLREPALGKTASGTHPIVPGRPESSELVARIFATDADRLMPPPDALKPLSREQRETLRRWVAEGAEYAEHWAFATPHRPALPDASSLPRAPSPPDASLPGDSSASNAWPRNAIDHFVLRRLAAAGLAPAAEADRAVWLRRVTLDLTGLPPSPAELRDFLADPAPDAYERVVDRLLVAPAHAERMAMQWLDAARYADTNGYNNDETRTMWPWRDWVIAAFQNGMPYDQFLTEQLAGDLLPQATLAQRVATGFNRNHVLTTEGGIIEEEYHVEYVADRVHTAATVFLGLSLQCARCHDHKFDPFSQRDYYRFAAFFDNVPDKIVGYSKGRMAEPLLKVPTPAQQAELDRLRARQNEVTELLKARDTTLAADLAKWESGLTEQRLAALSPLALAAHFPLDEAEGRDVVDAADAARRAVIHGAVSRGPGRIGNALQFDGATFVDAGQAGAFDSDQGFSLSAWFQLTSNAASTVLSKMDDANAFRGYDIIVENGKVASHFVHHWPDRGFKVVTREAVALEQWHHVAVVYDGSRRAAGVRIYVDGQPQQLDVTTDKPLDGPLATDKPFHIGRRQASSPFHGQIDDVRLYSIALPLADAQRLAAGEAPRPLQDLLAVKPDARTAEQRELLRQIYAAAVDPQSRQLRLELADIPNRIAAIESEVPATMVMAEMTPRRSTYILTRGQYDQRGAEVSPGLPAAISAEVKLRDATTRLDLARWLTDPAHPLTARVAVNRWWEMLFGAGLVETAEDFGAQGARPSHPQLLDWLATELIRQDWDHRAVLKQIVLSATYRQSSNVTPRLLDVDPHNRLLARGSRSRLPAEQVRDNALAISGLLDRSLGGPSVRPYQPAGLWEDVSVERRDKYQADTGSGLYRRSMYTFWKRTCPPPTMSAFDAPDRETCLIRRARTNTPLQALVLLNDPTYIEAARCFATRVWRHAAADRQRLDYAFQVALARRPQDVECSVLLEFLAGARERFSAQPAAAGQLLAVGSSTADPAIDAAELAAWTSVASMILNLDETISKR